MFSFLRKKPKRLANIAVYYLNEVIDGIAYSNPIGTMPRLNDEYEQELNVKHEPKPEFDSYSYINEEINGSSVILCWQHGQIEAICFLSKKEAIEVLGFTPFTEEDLTMLEKALSHFPRKE